MASYIASSTCAHTHSRTHACLPPPRWLIYLGLALFLSVASYIAYKRAPAPVRMPIDMALGLAARGSVLAYRQVKTSNPHTLGWPIP